MNQIAKEAAQKIIWDLTCKKGLKHEWDCIDKEIQEEIEEAWNKIIVEQFSNRFEQQVKPTLAELNRYTNRIVVVDHRQGSSDYGRTIDAYHVKLEFDWQDYGKTLKIFINDR